MATPVQWGHVAQDVLVPYHVRNAARQAYSLAPMVSRETFSRPGVGQVMNLAEVSSPGVAIYRHAFGENGASSQSSGSSDAGPVLFGVGVSAGVLVVLVALSVAINYQLGKAMAPNKQAESKWAWGNAIGGTLFPPFTLGMAVYKNYFRD